MKWKLVFVLLALGIFVAIGYVNRHEITQAFDLIKTVRWPILLLVPVVQFVSFYSNAKYYQTFLETFKYRIGLAKLYKLSLALNFVNQASPSMGITGITFLSYGLRGEVPTGKSTLVQYGRYVLTYLSFAVLLVAALLLIYFGGGIDKIIVRIVIILLSSSLLLGAIFFLAFSSRERFNGLIYWLQRVIDWLVGKFRGGKPLVGEARIKRLLEEFHEGFDLVRLERHRLRAPFAYALLGNVMEVLTIYVVFLALGTTVNFGAVIISYAIASAAAVASVIPGDVGVYEVSLVAGLSATGIPVAIGLSATLLYRILNKALFLPIGFYYYTKTVNAKKQITQA